MTRATDVRTGTWVALAGVDAWTPWTGRAALVHGHQVAVFRLGHDDFRAIGNLDPITGANVLARGIVGDADGHPNVASPLLKQRWDLATGACLDDPDLCVPTWEVRVRDGVVEVFVPAPITSPTPTTVTTPTDKDAA